MLPSFLLSLREGLEASLIIQARRGASYQSLDATYVFIAAMLANLTCIDASDQDACIDRHIELLLHDYSKEAAP